MQTLGKKLDMRTAAAAVAGKKNETENFVLKTFWNEKDCELVCTPNEMKLQI